MKSKKHFGGGFFFQFFSRKFPKKNWKKFRKLFGIFDLVVGIFLLALGILGFLLPILPGFVFFGAGILMLFPERGKIFLKKIKSFFRRQK